jgi:general secretion pathway protein J
MRPSPRHQGTAGSAARHPGVRTRTLGGPAPASPSPPRRHIATGGPRGFTLVELLVALLILAVVATMAWQGVDAMLRSRDISTERLDRQLRLQSTIAQWETDLEAVQDSGVVPALQFDGANLRLTRRSDAGLQVVVWSLRGPTWTRWAAPAATRTLALQEAWMRSQQLLGNEPGQLRALTGLAGWQVYFWRGNAWTNAQSTGDLAPGLENSAPPTPAPEAGPARQALPEGVRLVLSFAEGGGRAGQLTRDLLLAPPSSP